jgi:hypothetical protein
VSDQPGALRTTTNGNHAPTDLQSRPAGSEVSLPVTPHSMDERLEALMQTIRTWDWRSGPVTVTPPSISDPTDESAVPPPPAPADAQTLIDPTPRHARTPSLPVEQPDGTIPPPGPLPAEQPLDPPTLIFGAPVEESAVGGSPQTALVPRLAPVPTDQPEATVPSVLPSQPEAPQDPPTLIVTTPVPPAAASVHRSLSAPSTASDLHPDATGVEPQPEVFQTKSRSRAKVGLICLAALVVVLLIIGAIRLISDKSQGSGPSDPSPTTTTVRQPASHTAASVAQAPLPIPSAELTQYEQYAQSLNQANTTAAKTLAHPGASLTPGEVVPVATIYSTDLNTYSLSLAYIKWPAALETAVKADQAQLVIMANYLRSIDAVSPTGLSSWLTQLKAQAATTQTMDNALRQELDLPKTTSFPT